MMLLCMLLSSSVVQKNKDVFVEKVMQFSGYLATSLGAVAPPPLEEELRKEEEEEEIMDSSSLTTMQQQNNLGEPELHQSYLDDEYVGMMLTDDYDSNRPFSLLSHQNNHYQKKIKTSNNNGSTSGSGSFKEELLGQETIASMTGSILDQLGNSLLDFNDSDDASELMMMQFSTTNSSDGSCGRDGILFHTPISTTATTSTSSSTHPAPSLPQVEKSLLTFSTDSLDKSLLLTRPPACYQFAFFNNQDLKTSSSINNFKTTLTQSLPQWEVNNLISSNSNRRHAELTSKINQKEKKVYSCPPLPNLDFISTTNANKKKLQKISENNNEIADWESLKILLPEKYKDFNKNKPLNEREKEDVSEKDQDEHDDEGGGGNGEKWVGGAGAISDRGQQGGAVKMRSKRYSLGAGCVTDKNKFKRFSLREIEEVVEICGGIEGVLKDFEGLMMKTKWGSGGGGEQKKNAMLVSRGSGGGDNNNSNSRRGSGGEKYSKEKSDVIKQDRRKTSTPICSNICNRKSDLTHSVTNAINQLTKRKTHHPSSAKITSSSQPAAGVVLEGLCPALFALLSDGLLPYIETIFGKVPNTVWRVVEASVHNGPSSQLLQELLLRINSENETMSDGPLKFNAFICGLLNLSSLNSWLLLLRTKDRLLRTHYDQNGMLFQINTNQKSAFDSLVAKTEVLNNLNFSLDIFHETKMLHRKIIKNCSGNFNGNSKMKRSFSDERPKTAVVRNAQRLPKSKTQQNIDKIEENKFKKLQLQWEMISTNDLKSPTSSTAGSRIPRPIMSNVVTPPLITREGVVAQKHRVNVRPSSAYYK